MEGVTKAAVETVAENAGDGVIAPLLCMLIGGAPLALTYKAINTMDSMLGYKNEKYINFGRVPAKLDDAANYIPSRIAAPTARRPKVPALVRSACSSPGPHIISVNTMISRRSATRCARSCRRTF